MFTPIKKLFYVASISLFVIACKQNDKQLKGNAVGDLGTLTIVADEEIHKALKDVYNDIFLSTKGNNALTEPFSQVLQPTINEFKDFFFNQRTILVLVTEKNVKSLDFLFQNFKDNEVESYINSGIVNTKSVSNILANNQEVLFVFGKTIEQIKQKLEIDQINIIRTLLKNELKAQVNALKDSTQNTEIYNEIKTKFGVGIAIPSNFTLKQKSENFYLFEMQNKADANEPKVFGIMLHTYPYKDTTDFNYLNVRSVRDSICKYNIPGEIAGTYMSTSESDYYPTRLKEMVNLNGYKASKINGWWTVKGVSLAGPFLRYTIHIPEKNTIFAFEGYVNKANLNVKDKDIRLFEAIAQSIK